MKTYILLKFSIFIALIALFIATSKSFVIRKRNPKIIIVGAGLSGISAASKLMENGFSNILILEAENRTGGRIHTVPFSDGMIDLGGQWVHGQGDNVIYEMMKDHYTFGSTGFDFKPPLYLQSTGEEIDQAECEKYAHIAHEILFSSYGEMSTFTGSIGNFFDIKYKEMVGNVDDLIPTMMRGFYEKEMNVWNGSSSWYEISAQYHTISGFNPGIGHMAWNKDGYKTVFDYITKKKPDPSKALDVERKIRFNKEVINIQWNPKWSIGLVVVTCADGQKFFADHVIFTGSLGVLKAKHRSLFSPALPANMAKAITSMGMGTLGKIFLEFENPFWPVNDPEWIGYGMLWTPEDEKKLNNTNSDWILDIQFFARIDAYPNVLEALLAGPRIRKFETISDDQLIKDVMWLLEKFLKKSLPKPKAMQRTKWMTSKNFLGSYSFFSMETFKSGTTTRILKEPLFNAKSKPEVLFAGEATDEKYSSNAHGAVNSGYRAADQLIKYYNN